MSSKIEKRKKRILHIRKSVRGTAGRPRLLVYRSLNHIYAQIIDDEARLTLASSSDFEVNGEKASGVNIAKKVGESLAKKAIAKKINKVVFDRRGYKYHGRVKALADAVREGGLQF